MATDLSSRIARQWWHTLPCTLHPRNVLAGAVGECVCGLVAVLTELDELSDARAHLAAIDDPATVLCDDTHPNGLTPAMRALRRAVARMKAAEADAEQLRDWITIVHGYSATCDWGDCDAVTVGYRGSPDIGAIQDWLPVCQQHYDEAPESERLYMGNG